MLTDQRRITMNNPNNSPASDPSGLTLPKNAPPAFHILSKPTGAICNLDCKYCFFLSKEMLYPGSRFRMADELLETYIKQLLESHQTPEVTIAWQGGEPTLMGLEFFQKSVQYADKYKRPHQRIEYTVQTNGTQLDDELCAFFKKNNFLVGLSVDGPREIHDTYRVNKGGEGSFDQVMRGLDNLKKHNVDFNIMCTVHAANQNHPLELYHFFRDELGAQYLQFIPIVERVSDAMLPIANQGWSERPGGDRPLYTIEGSLVTDRSVQAEPFGKFLMAIFDEWVRRDVGKIYVQHFDSALANWLGVPGAVCIFAETCGGALALEHNGDLYSCDHYVEPALQARQHSTEPHDRALNLAGADQVRPRQARHVAEILPAVRSALRLSRRMSQEPFYHHAGRRAGAQLSVRGLQSVFQTYRPADEDDGRICCATTVTPTR